VLLQPIDPPLFSDYSAVVVDLDRHLLEVSLAVKVVRRWRSFDVEAFARDLLQSEWVTALPSEVSIAFEC
jgi:hypothetical protein